MRPLPALAALLLLAMPSALPAGIEALWPDGPGHVHSNPAHHAGVGAGMAQLAQLPLRSGSTGELDALGSKAVVAHFGGGAGLSVVDASNPAAPRILGQMSLGTGAGMDVKLLPGGQRAVLATQGGACAPPLPPAPPRTGCGINLVDISNPAAMRVLAALPFGTTLGVHMFEVAAYGPVPVLFIVGQGAAYAVGIVAVVGDQFVPLGALATDSPNLYVHDVTVRPDPLTGRTFAYVAAWDQGVWVYDVTVPTGPVLLGRWDPPEANNIHTVMVAYVEGRRIIVAGPEFLNTVHVLDATNLLDIQRIGTWRFPDNKPEGGITWSAHNFNVRDNKVYLAHYHGGVIVLGLRTLAEAASPPMLAYILPTGVPQTGGNTPSTWDAFPADDGTIYAGDLTLGFVTLRET